MIDIRSDTVTQPTDEMRAAMASAEVGDDVYGDDPTVNRLEELAARTLGKEAAIFVPSGTFGNQVSIFSWSERGSEVILAEESHIVQHEAGAAAIIAGVQLRALRAPRGVLDAGEVRERVRLADLHAPRTSLICVENASANGRAVPLVELDAVKSLAEKHGLPVHMDGARIFNAAASLGLSAAEIAKRADSVMFCLSKGLCAPVGSMVTGPKAFIGTVRLKRKIMGGGLRQAGILAAAGIIAIEKMSGRVGEDNGRARVLARELSAIRGVKVDPKGASESERIDMVFFDWDGPAGITRKSGADEWTAAALKIVAAFAARGIKISPPDGAGQFRFVTHYWVGTSELDLIIQSSKEIFGKF
jgi:threonine aldolase